VGLVKAGPLPMHADDVRVFAYRRKCFGPADGAGEGPRRVERAEVMGTVADIAHDRSRVKRHSCHHPLRPARAVRTTSLLG